MQRLFLSMEAGSGRVGFEQWVFRLGGPLDSAALREAWEATVARHAILRAAFVADVGHEPLQVVKRRVETPWAEMDWTGGDVADAKDRLQSFLDSDRERGFDVGVAPLNRLTLIRLADDDHRLVWSTHHLYVDGWSWPLIFRDVGAAYAARVAGVAPQLAQPCQYGAYIGWLADAAPDSRLFWKESLEGFTSPTPLPRELTPVADAEDAIRETSTRLDGPTTAALQSLARAQRVTVNTVVQGSWAILLSHLSGRDDVVFGAAFSGRPPELPGVETLVGPCVNNLPVRVRLDGGRVIADWLAELHELNLEIAQHQYASPSDIQEWAGVPWRLRLFDSLVVFQNYFVDEAVRTWGAVDVEPLSAPEATNYPLTLTVTPGDEITLRLLGQATVFGIDSLETVLDGLVDGPLESGPAPRLAALRDRVLAAGLDEGHGGPGVGLARAGDVRGSRQRDGARGRRGLGGAVPARPGGHGGQLLRSRRAFDSPSPSPRAASRADEGRPVRRRVAPVPHDPLSRPVPQRRRHFDRGAWCSP